MNLKQHLPQRRYTRVIGYAAVLFSASAFVHLCVAVGRGWDWAGAVSFRKPVTFAVSFALLFAALWWALDRLPNRPRLGWFLAAPLVAGSVVETLLITMQSWRGEASHFNVQDAFNGAVFSLMGVSILVVSIAIVGIALWAFIEPPKDRAAALAVRSGLIMVVLGLGLGIPLIEAGFAFLERTGQVPNSITVGAAGVAKFPHAIAFHGVQFLILLVVAGQRVAASNRLMMVRFGVVSYSLLLLWSSLHTNQGRAPMDLSGIESGLLIGALATLVAAALVWKRGFTLEPRRDTLPV
jgi:hypothetical protein